MFLQDFYYSNFKTYLKFTSTEIYQFLLIILFIPLFWIFVIFLLPSKFELTPLLFNIILILTIFIIIYINITFLFNTGVYTTTTELLYMAPIYFWHLILIKIFAIYIKFHILLQFLYCFYLHTFFAKTLLDLIAIIIIYNSLFGITIATSLLFNNYKNFLLLNLNGLLLCSLPVILNILRIIYLYSYNYITIIYFSFLIFLIFFSCIIIFCNILYKQHFSTV